MNGDAMGGLKRGTGTEQDEPSSQRPEQWRPGEVRYRTKYSRRSRITIHHLSSTPTASSACVFVSRGATRSALAWTQLAPLEKILQRVRLMQPRLSHSRVRVP